MGDPTERALRLLGILEGAGSWPAPRLARQLGVSERTVRRDAQRLRDLGYDVRSRPGPGAAYRLHPGVKVPPLLFTEDEVGAVAAGLSVLAVWAPLDPAVGAAAAKLEHVLPRRLRQRARATALSTQVSHQGEPGVDFAAIGTLADAVAHNSRVRFDYTDRHDRSSTRDVEPYRHLLRDNRWYLVAFDVGREEWRCFRLDRLRNPSIVGPGGRVHDFPDSSLEHWLATDFGRSKREDPTGPGHPAS